MKPCLIVYLLISAVQLELKFVKKINRGRTGPAWFMGKALRYVWLASQDIKKIHIKINKYISKKIFYLYYLRFLWDLVNYKYTVGDLVNYQAAASCLLPCCNAWRYTGKGYGVIRARGKKR
jgi:hypothetical protein